MRPLPILFSVAIVLFSTAIVGCGGGNAGSSTEPQPLDPAEAELWSKWATEAQVIAATTARMYSSQVMTRELLQQQIDATQALADEIESAEPSADVVLNLSASLDEIANALKFVLEFAIGQGSLNVGGIKFRPLEDTLQQLSHDADALSQAVAEAEG